ncbi:MAG: Ig-like domain-containing protein, partial [Spirochaetaceae bacterium]|nr:Ig-like domain-containing protein [Spirochaetaceae bacterium]
QGAGSWTDLTTTGTTNWGATIDTSALADGVYDWQVVATDNFTKTNTVDRIFTLDTTAPQIAIANPAAAASVNGSMLVSGTATDKWQTTADGFQVSSVLAWIGAGASPTPPATTSYYAKSDGVNLLHDATNWKELTGTNSWNYRYNTTGMNGTYTISIVAFDNSGNVSSASTRTVTYDQSTNLPAVTFTNLSAGYYGGTIDSSTTSTFTDDALVGATVATGWYARFQATGEMRRVSGFAASTVTFAPALAAIPVGAYDLLPNLVGASGSLQGEISDDDGVNPATVEIAIDRNGDGDYLDIDEGFLAVDSTSVVGGKVQFTTSVSTLAQGLAVYKFQVRASDIGEASYGVAAVTTTTAEHYFAKDDAAPSSPTLTEFGNGFELKTTGIAGSNFNDAMTLRGTASDSARVGLVEAKVGSKSFAAATNTGTHYSTWYFSDPAVGASEGEITVQVRVTDVFGKATTESFVFNVDKTAPTFAFDNPGAGAMVNGSLLSTGTASDTYRVSNVYYWVEDGSNPAPALPGSIASWSAATGTTSWSFRFDSTARSNGAKTLKIVARDNAGNLGTVATRSVNFDQGLNKPSIRFTGLTVGDLRGTASATATTSMTDPSLIGNGNVTAGWLMTFSDGTTTRSLSAFNATTGQMSWASALGSAFPAGSSYSLSAPTYTVDSHAGATITSAGLDGASPAPDSGWAVVFTNGGAGLIGVAKRVMAFNGSGGVTTLTDLPAGISDGSTTFKILPKTLIGSGATIAGTIIDDEGVDTATVEFAMDLNDDGDYADLDEAFQPVTLVTGSGTSVSFTQNLSALTQGATVYKVKFRVTDVGEAAYGIAAITTSTEEILIAKDDGAPGNPTLASFGNNYQTKASDIENSAIKDYIALGGNASDGVQVALVEVNVDGLGYQSATGTTSWTYSRGSLSLTSGNTVSAAVRVTDFWGRTTVTSFSFKADATVPTISANSIGRKLNGSETFQGTAGDLNSAVNKVYRGRGSGAVSAFDPANPTSNGWVTADVVGTTTWSHVFDTTAVHNLASDLAYNIAFTAVDEAGNYATTTLAETINQDANRPVIAFTNMGMTATATTNRFDANPKLIGTVQDDDGVNKDKILVSLDGSPYVAATNPPPVNGTANGTVSFSHELTDLTGTVDSATTTTMTDDALVGETQVTAGSWEAALTVSGSSVTRSISAFDSGTGQITWA